MCNRNTARFLFLCAALSAASGCRPGGSQSANRDINEWWLYRNTDGEVVGFDHTYLKYPDDPTDPTHLTTDYELENRERGVLFIAKEEFLFEGDDPTKPYSANVNVDFRYPGGVSISMVVQCRDEDGKTVWVSSGLGEPEEATTELPAGALWSPALALYLRTHNASPGTVVEQTAFEISDNTVEKRTIHWGDFESVETPLGTYNAQRIEVRDGDDVDDTYWRTRGGRFVKGVGKTLTWELASEEIINEQYHRPWRFLNANKQ